MAKPKKTTEEKVENLEKPTATKDITKVIVKIKDIDVKGGIRHRTYTQEEHGDKFKELADEFCETNKQHVLGKTFE
jgi:hypothetical protein